MPPIRKDFQLGRIAVERGWLTSAQLDECLREQQILPNDPNRTLGSAGRLRPIGVVMLEKGYLTEKQLLELLEEQGRRQAQAENLKKGDYLFGQLLVHLQHATQNQINKCMEIQRQRAIAGKGKVPRLGELLIEHGFVAPEVIQQALRLQDKQVLLCTNCGKQFNVVGVQPGKTYRCRRCTGILVPTPLLKALNVEETNFDTDPPAPPPQSTPPAPR